MPKYTLGAYTCSKTKLSEPAEGDGTIVSMHLQDGMSESHENCYKEARTWDSIFEVSLGTASESHSRSIRSFEIMIAAQNTHIGSA